MPPLPTRLRGKLDRYRGLVRNVANWPAYLAWKASGARGPFTFEIPGLGTFPVEGRRLGPFRENLLDEVYYVRLPEPARALLPEAPVVLDVGANVGYFALGTFLRYPRAKVYSFEPHPYCLGELRRERDRFPQFEWVVDPRALGERDGEVALHTTGVNQYSSTSGTRPHAARGVAVDVPLATLDTALATHGLAWVDLAKIDAEGGEYPLLYGAGDEALRRVRVLAIEAHPDPKPRHDRASLADHLRERGFTVDRRDASEEAALLFAWREDYRPSPALAR